MLFPVLVSLVSSCLITQTMANILPYQPDEAISCSSTNHCPKEWPCCSQFSTCGSGPVCIVGCDPRYSFSQLSCLPQAAFLPLRMMNKMTSEQVIKESALEDNPKVLDIFSNDLQAHRYEFTNFYIANQDQSQDVVDTASKVHKDDINSPRLHETRIIPWTQYLLTDNMATAQSQWESIDFTYSGTLKAGSNGEPELLLTMPKNSVGSLLTTTRAVLYGKIAVKLKSARSGGVITSLVLFSAVHDEIDFELLGGDLMFAQTNYYYHGELDHTRMRKYPVSSNIHDNYHMYEIDWNEDRLIWLIDGQIVRVLNKAETWDPVARTFKYPQTPMKINVSIWPGGSSSNPRGTIEWAGGLIDWENAPDILESGEFACRVSEVIVEPFQNKLIEQVQERVRSSPQIAHNLNIFFEFEPKTEVHQFNYENVAMDFGPAPYLKNFRSDNLNR